MPQKTWFITGTSKGFGRVWATAALERGDRVAATARDRSALDDLVDRFGEDRILPLELDVTDRGADVRAVEATIARFGRIDVAVNNAGFGHFGYIEELSESEARAQLDTNFFGALWVSQAVIPHMRTQGSGHLLQVSSIGGITAFPDFGIYNASKWALEGMSQALAAEVAPFGIHVTLIEPGGFATDWGGSSSTRSQRVDAYDALRAEGRRRRGAGGKAGDPAATAAAVLRLVDSPEPPLRVFFGSHLLGVAAGEYERRIAVWEQWSDLAHEAEG